tara:strand:+ start:1472 stop:1753 length:282 start_codon:yes stop_codon:yes gene_type:complete
MYVVVVYDLGNAKGRTSPRRAVQKRTARRPLEPGNRVGVSGEGNRLLARLRMEQIDYPTRAPGGEDLRRGRRRRRQRRALQRGDQPFEKSIFG